MEKMKEEMEKAMNREMNNRGGHGGPGMTSHGPPPPMPPRPLEAENMF